MNKGIIATIGFLLGAAAGSVVAWKFLDKKYADRAQEEIDSVKEVYSKRMAEMNKTYKEMKVKLIEKDLIEPDLEFTVTPSQPEENLVEQHSTAEMKVDYSSYFEPKKEESKEMPDEKPYFISQEEFEENEDYDKIILTYYSDGVLTDDMDEPIENIEETVGEDPKDHFGEYEDGVVYVRNDKRMVDYEILLDEMDYYGGVVQTKPPRRGVL